VAAVAASEHDAGAGFVIDQALILLATPVVIVVVRPVVFPSILTPPAVESIPSKDDSDVSVTINSAPWTKSKTSRRRGKLLEFFNASGSNRAPGPDLSFVDVDRRGPKRSPKHSRDRCYRGTGGLKRGVVPPHIFIRSVADA
jgi:hypothetical protein